MTEQLIKVTNINGNPPTNTSRTVPGIVLDQAYYLQFKFDYASEIPDNFNVIDNLAADGWDALIEFIPNTPVGSTVTYDSTVDTEIDTSATEGNRIFLELPDTLTVVGTFADTSYTIRVTMVRNSISYVFFQGNVGVYSLGDTLPVYNILPQFVYNATVMQGETLLLPIIDADIDWGFISGTDITLTFTHQIHIHINGEVYTTTSLVSRQDNLLEFSLPSDFTPTLPIGNGSYVVTVTSSSAVELGGVAGDPHFFENYPIQKGTLEVTGKVTVHNGETWVAV